jgi:adhesin HecA-like repeat protein
MLIDDFSRPDLRSCLGTEWRAVSDRVMGGVSKALITIDRIDGRNGLRLRGHIRIDNDGGFGQAAVDLAPPGQTLDASSYDGIRFLALGNDERYAIHLRTLDCVRPWQSYRAQFAAAPKWQLVTLPFTSFVPHRLMTPLDTGSMRRLGLVAIGRRFEADVMISDIGLFRTVA